MSDEIIKILDDLGHRFGIAIIITIFMITEAKDIIAVNVIPEKIFYEYLNDPTS